MSDPDSSVPAVATGASTWIVGIPKALIPSSLKAVDRLIGAAVDYPVALIEQKTAQIKTKTAALALVESSIASVAASEASGDSDIVRRAVETLVRKEYRRQDNREAVVSESILLLKESISENTASNITPEELDDDWLNIFERYIEDASTDRMRSVWSRVLSGEIRKPGRFSVRTLRFLSEFSQADAILFESIASFFMNDFMPKSLSKYNEDITPLLHLEAAGLINIGSGSGLEQRWNFSPNGFIFLQEGELVLSLKGDPGLQISCQIYALTPLGCELIHLLPNRDTKEVMRSVGRALRSQKIASAHICVVDNDDRVVPIEMLWDDTAGDTIENS
ncbi:DUF2806 domain-containing protein [Sphingomonas sp. AOB5]|uniref:DUF2806 domain-containing protein n=1 Tax=Sphingomonas sp. AOB5 TaxID=3034017 RepID=UPI0023F92FF7|nr:DUF2806 domain-containing protein [Sphingomonas sp. AOB5]MDF7774444.1 DUF2806 domain-containing protein [Sphingomonas sp. AOB5]